MRQVLDLHNKERADVGVAALEWDRTLEHVARQWATSCPSGASGTRHSDGEWRRSRYTAISGEEPPGGSIGENLAYGPEAAGKDALGYATLWFDEKFDLDCPSDRCVRSICGHYRQAVWGDSTQIGCAINECSSQDIFLVCMYAKWGNLQAPERPFPAENCPAGGFRGRPSTDSPMTPRPITTATTPRPTPIAPINEDGGWQPVGNGGRWQPVGTGDSSGWTPVPSTPRPVPSTPRPVPVPVGGGWQPVGTGDSSGWTPVPSTPRPVPVPVGNGGWQPVGNGGWQPVGNAGGWQPVGNEGGWQPVGNGGWQPVGNGGWQPVRAAAGQQTNLDNSSVQSDNIPTGIVVVIVIASVLAVLLAVLAAMLVFRVRKLLQLQQ